MMTSQPYTSKNISGLSFAVGESIFDSAISHPEQLEAENEEDPNFAHVPQPGQLSNGRCAWQINSK